MSPLNDAEIITNGLLPPISLKRKLVFGELLDVLKGTLYLTHFFPLVMLLDNEMRRSLERKHAGDDDNFFYP